MMVRDGGFPALFRQITFVGGECAGIAASKRLEMMAEIPVLKFTSEVESLARRLIGAGLVPATVAADAVHIATASVYAASDESTLGQLNPGRTSR